MKVKEKELPLRTQRSQRFTKEKDKELSKRHRWLLFALVGILLLSFLPACSNTAGMKLAMAPLEDMLAQVRSAPATVQQAYRFAAANPEVMKQIPCYCGCGALGHTSNYSCYVDSAEASGKITFDDHALGCSICVDITQDVMRLLQQGKSPQEIKAAVDSTYSKYGPSNMP